MATMRSLILLVCCIPLFAFASLPTVTHIEDQNEVLIIEDITDVQEFFGRLSDFPHTYEFIVNAPLPFEATVFVHDVPAQVNDASLIVIKEEKRGVGEIGRTQGKNASWESERSTMLAESFRNGGEIKEVLQPGVYRLEVSSPNNDAVYRLQLGEGDPSYGYFEAVGILFKVKSLVGSSMLSTLHSPLVYWPLLVVFGLLSLFTYLYVKRRKKE